MKTYTTYTKEGKTYLSPGDILLFDTILPNGTILSEEQIELKWQWMTHERKWLDELSDDEHSASVAALIQTRQVANLKPKVIIESTDKVSWTPPTGTIVNGYVPQEKYDALVEQFNKIKEIVNQIEL
jgi:hypothetical protein